MNLFSIRDYFEIVINITNMSLVKDKKLRKKELEFLLECCLLNYNGVSLTDFEALWEHFKASGFIKKRNDISGYKKKLGERRWIQGKRNVFVLPKLLDIKKEEDGFLIWVDGVQKRTKKLSFKKEFVLEFGKEEQ